MQYAALGFTLSPRGLHSAAKGSANHTIMFAQDYFELLGILTPTEGNASRRRLLAAAGQGLHAIATRVGDAGAAATELAARGIATEGLGHFSRPVPRADGSQVEAAFSTLAFATPEVPRGIMFMCQHHTRGAVWLPELMRHANGALGLAGIVAITDDPEGEGTRFARLWRDGHVAPVAGGVRVDTGPASAPLHLMQAGAFARAYPGLNAGATATGAFAAMRIAVAAMADVLACLSASGVPHVETTGGVAVGPEHAGGVIVEFVPA